MSEVTSEVAASGTALGLAVPKRRFRLASVLWKFARRKPLGAFSGLLLVLLVAGAVLSDVLPLAAWDVVDQSQRLQSPSFSHPLGTDQFGRDILSRVLRGARISLQVGLGGTVLGVSIATSLGVISGYRGGIVDNVIQRCVDVVQAIPPVILLIGIIAILGPSVLNVTLALAFRTSFESSRVARGAVVAIKDSPFVEAARVLGAGSGRIIFSHLLPNIFAPMIIIFTLNVGVNILSEAALSFLGYGVPPPEPSWGGMLSGQNRLYMISAPWLLIGPGVALTLTVYAVNMFGDALRDVLDPRMRGV